MEFKNDITLDELNIVSSMLERHVNIGKHSTMNSSEKHTSELITRKAVRMLLKEEEHAVVQEPVLSVLIQEPEQQLLMKEKFQIHGTFRFQENK